MKEEGFVGLTRGMRPKVLHSDCFSALGYFAFETAKIAILNEYVKRKELEHVVVSSSIEFGNGFVFLAILTIDEVLLVEY